MIHLRPTPETRFVCVYCQTPLACLGWYMPGMRNLAELKCHHCLREFYGDLPAGQALFTPLLLDKQTGEVHDPFGVAWFADWLRQSYVQRTDAPLPFTVHEHSPLRHEVVLLNCLDTLYGHSLLKLLNAQHYLDQRPDVDLIVLIPACLAWLVPDGVAQTWIVDLPLRRGTEWNDWLARTICRRVETLPSVSLDVTFSHPHPDDYQIERFTRVEPFPLADWTARLARPTVTFIWREDRLWATPDESLAGKITRRVGRTANLINEQLDKVMTTAEALRRQCPPLDFALVGMGEPGGLPGWVSDLRRTALDTTVEREWCARYAASHIVVGVHGSNMLLPSAHAGAVVELIGRERQGNFMQDILCRSGDPRELLFRYRFLPPATPPAELAELLALILYGYPDFQRLMSPEFCRHRAAYDFSHWQMAR